MERQNNFCPKTALAKAFIWREIVGWESILRERRRNGIPPDFFDRKF